MARDWCLLMQTEIGEVLEPAAEGKGGSSTMPHKRNPVAASVVLSAATRAPSLVATMLAGMVQEHGRGLGGWQAEWERLPELAVLVSGAVRATLETLRGLEIDENRMRTNLELTRGLIMAEAVQMALGTKLGRQQAHRLIERASKQAASEGRHLKETLLAEPEVMAHLSPADLDRLLDPLTYTGVAQALIDRALAAAED